MINSFTAVDIETTGLDPLTERIIEIGAVKVVNGKTAAGFSQLINPGRPLTERIINLTGIRDDMLREAPDAEGVLEAFLDFAGEDILLGHNILFDYSFLKRYYAGMKISYARRGIDTLAIARMFHNDLESRSLTSMCRYYRIDNRHAHRALDDAAAARDLYFKMAEQFYEAKEAPFLPRELIFRVKKEEPITRRQKNYLLDLMKCHKIEAQSILDGKESVDCLTKSEASKKIDSIIYHFGRIL